MTLANRNMNPLKHLSRLDIVVWTLVLIIIAILFALSQLTQQARIGTSIAYLYPAYGGIQNVWLSPLDTQSEPFQLTFAQDGIYDFGVSTDGNFLVYSERIEPTGLHELMMINMVTRQVTQLTNCVAEEVDCRAPAFRPQGNALAYERVSANTGVGTGVGVVRVWLIDLSTRPYSNRPLTQDSNFIGHSPVWSEDGSALSFYSSDLSNPGIMLYTFSPTEGDPTLKFIPSQYGVPGALSPNGQQVVFPDLSRRPDDKVYSFLRIADLAKLEYVNLTNPEDEIDDTDAEWHPDGEHLAIVRRYTDERFTRGFQLYYMTLADKSVKPLIVDEAYTHGFFAFDRTGERMVLQRFPLDPSAPTGSNPQVWVYDMATQALRQVADNAFYPRWVNGESGE